LNYVQFVKETWRAQQQLPKITESNTARRIDVGGANIRATFVIGRRLCPFVPTVAAFGIFRDVVVLKMILENISYTAIAVDITAVSGVK